MALDIHVHGYTRPYFGRFSSVYNFYSVIHQNGTLNSSLFAAGKYKYMKGIFYKGKNLVIKYAKDFKINSS